MLQATQLRDESKVRDLRYAKLQEDYKVVIKQLSRRRSDPNQQDTPVTQVYNEDHLFYSGFVPRGVRKEFRKPPGSFQL